MKSKWLVFCLMLSLSLILVIVPAAQSADSGTCNFISLFNAWSPATVPGAPNGVVYGLLVNLGGAEDTLLDASTDVAQAVELHQSSMDANGVMQMNPVDGGVAVPANGYAELVSGGLHMMLVNLLHPLEVGSSFTLTLHFEHAGNVEVSVPVQALPMAGDTMDALATETVDTNMSGMAMSGSDSMAMATPETGALPMVDAACQGMHVVSPWARPSIPGAPNTAAYALLLNLTDSPDTLISVSTDVAQAAELHTMVMNQSGVMAMTPLADGITVPAGGAVLLKPGGMHVMIIGLKQSIDDGSSFDLTFTFAHSGSLTLTLPVHAPEDSSTSMGGM